MHAPDVPAELMHADVGCQPLLLHLFSAAFQPQLHLMRTWMYDSSTDTSANRLAAWEAACAAPGHGPPACPQFLAHMRASGGAGSLVWGPCSFQRTSP